MSRGFNTTFGVATTDKIVSTLTTMPTLISISVWAYRNGDGGDTFGALCEAEGDGGQLIIFGNDPSNNGFRFFRGWGPGGSTGGRWWAPRPATGAWHHYAVTYNGSATTNDPLMYLDGVSQTVTQDTGNPTGTINTTASTWNIGNRGSDNSKCWDGMEDNFAIATRIWTPAEVAQLASGVSPSTPSLSANLVEYITMLGTGTPASQIRTAPTITGTKGQSSDAPPIAHRNLITPVGISLVPTPFSSIR